MAESNTTRFGLRRWTAGTDTPQRSEFDASLLSLSQTAAGWLAVSTAALRPTAAAANDRFLHYASDTNRMSYSDGAAWFNVPLPAEVTAAASTAAADAVTAHEAADDPHDAYVLADGTRTITVSGTAPSSPATNDLWVDTA
jgi:hypothetical protein